MTTIQPTNSRRTILIVGIALLIVATGLLILHFFTTGRPDGYADGTGIIDHITTTWIGVGENATADHDYYVKYTYEGTEYISKLGNFSGMFEVGQEIQILINMNDPTIIQNLGTAQGNMYSLIGCFLVYGFGAIFMIIYLLMFLFKKKKDNQTTTETING